MQKDKGLELVYENSIQSASGEWDNFDFTGYFRNQVVRSALNTHRVLRSYIDNLKKNSDKEYLVITWDGKISEVDSIDGLDGDNTISMVIHTDKYYSGGRYKKELDDSLADEEIRQAKRHDG